MRILILGGNGMIGHKMYQILSAVCNDTWVLLRQDLDRLPYKRIFNKEKVIGNVDCKEFDKLTNILESLNPDIIVNAAGITIRRGINNSLCHSILLNAALPHFLEEWVNGKKAKRLIHFSTDCVFSGKIGSYTEESETDANDYYGRTKALGEVKGPKSLTIRGSMIGRELANHTELLEWCIAQNGKKVKGFSNVIYSGITTVRMAEFVKEIIFQIPTLSGVYNVSSIPISKYELLMLFRKVFNLDIEILNDESYSARKDLISEKFYIETGLVIPNWEDLILQLKEDSILYKEYYKN
jgi:dTDP-4-dehydrorhamnose reductase